MIGLPPRIRVAGIALIASFAVGCAYFNGVYNARAAQKSGDRRHRAGDDAQAFGAYQIAAAKAESVLARFPKSRWRAEALYIAGRGHAYSDRCPAAIERLNEFLALTGVDADKRARAQVALGSCLTREGRIAEAMPLLEPLTRYRERDVAVDAALWAGRASIALADPERAGQFFSLVGTSSAQWELAAAALTSGRFAEAESLFALRAAAGDFREEILTAMGDLWRAGRQQAVDTIVARYDRSRLGSRSKARVLLRGADLMIASNLDERANWALLRARRLAVDTLIDREAAARLALLRLGELTTTVDARAMLNRAGESARSSALYRRLDRAMLMVTLLEAEQDVTGASMFLAAEVARDSLRARRLSEVLFRRVAEQPGGALLAPKALLAMAALRPESTEVYTARIREEYPRSPWTFMLEGGDPGPLPAWGAAERLLRQRWDAAVRAVDDTMRARRGELPSSSVGARPPAPSS